MVLLSFRLGSRDLNTARGSFADPILHCRPPTPGTGQPGLTHTHPKFLAHDSQRKIWGHLLVRLLANRLVTLVQEFPLAVETVAVKPALLVGDLKAAARKEAALPVSEVVDGRQVVADAAFQRVRPVPHVPKHHQDGAGGQQQGQQPQSEGDGQGGGERSLGHPGAADGRGQLDAELAAGAHEAARTLADVAGEVSVAGAAVLAGAGAAGVHANAAVLAPVAQGAGAGVGVGAVDAGAPVSAGVARAVVDVQFAAGAGKARAALAEDAPAKVQAAAA